MKVLTLRQPWATLVAEGIKQYEFRSWKTNYRGKVLIHAGAGVDKKDMERFKDLNLEYPSKRIIMKKQTILTMEQFKEQPPIEGTYGYVHIEDVHFEGDVPEPRLFRDVEILEIK